MALNLRNTGPASDPSEEPSSFAQRGDEETLANDEKDAKVLKVGIAGAVPMSCLRAASMARPRQESEAESRESASIAAYPGHLGN